MSGFFAGRYYKHQKEDATIACIIGQASSGEFIQIITNDEVLQYDSLDGCYVSRSRLRLNYPEIAGEVRYGSFHALQSPIMGPFSRLPMQCSHEVISMRHEVNGSFCIRGKTIDLQGATGYIEGDYGRSFPKEYLWLQCNDFDTNLSIMVSIAHIPFLGFHFTGCICAITYGNKEYRLATYRGVRIVDKSPNRIVLVQGKYRLIVHITPTASHALRSPNKGQMIGTIRESNNCKAEFSFTWKGRQLFHAKSNNCSYEYHYDKN